MSLASRAVRQLTHWYQIILKREWYLHAVAENPLIERQVARIESLEKRQLLDGVSQWEPAPPAPLTAAIEESLTLTGITEAPSEAGGTAQLSAGKTGDLVKVSLGDGVTEYQITDAATMDATPVVLSRVTAGQQLTLQRGGVVIGSFLATGGFDPATGILRGDLYFLPTGVSDIAGDGDPAAAGFQGQFRLTVQTTGETQVIDAQVTVQAGHSTGGSTGVDIGSPLCALQAVQRLQYLGYRSSAGQVLIPSIPTFAAAPAGYVMDAAAQSALIRFKSAVSQTTAAANASLDEVTARRLNDIDAPRWVESAAAVNAGTARYGTQWLISLLGDVAGQAGAQFAMADISSIAKANGETLGIGLATGRQHQYGTEVDIAVPTAAQAASAAPGLTAAEDRLVRLVVNYLAPLAQARGLKLSAVGISNTEIVSAINAALPGVASSATEAASRMHIAFVAAQRERVMSDEQREGLRQAFERLYQSAASIAEQEWWQWSWPILKQVSESDTLPTFASVLAIGNQLRDAIYTPVAAYLARVDATLAGLRDVLDGIAGMSAVTFTAATDDLAGRVAIAVDYDFTKTLAANLNLASYLGGNLAIDADVSAMLTASAALSVTLGVDSSMGATLTDRAFLRLDGMTAHAGLSANHLNLSARMGFADANIVEGNVSGTVDGSVAINSGSAFRLSAINPTFLASQVNLTLSASSLAVDLPLQVTVGSGPSAWTTPTGPLAPRIHLSDPQIFNPTTKAMEFAFTTELLNMAALLPFKQLSPSGVIQMLRQFGTMLGELKASDILDTPIPLLHGKTLGTIVGVDGAFTTRVVSLLEDATQNNTPTFLTIDQLRALFPSLLSQVRYVTGTSPKLEFTFHLSQSPTSSSAVGVDLQTLGISSTVLRALNTSANVAVNPSVGIDFVLSVEMVELGAAIPIDPATKTLASLNDGKGVKFSSDGKADVQVRLRDGTVFTANFDSLAGNAAVTISNLLSVLNSAAGRGRRKLEIPGNRRREADRSTRPEHSRRYQ